MTIPVKNVLLVDDNADLRKLVAKTLSHLAGWQVATAASGIDALSMLESESPDLILMDVSMPQMDGIATIGKIRERQELTDLPIILVTARVQSQEMQEYSQLDIAGVISKPFDPLELPGQIVKMLSRWQDLKLSSRSER